MVRLSNADLDDPGLNLYAIKYFFKNGPFLASFIFSLFQQLTVNMLFTKFLLLTGFEPETSDI